MIEALNQLDLFMFYFFNHTLSTGILDSFFSFITNVRYWFPVYIIALLYLVIKGGRKGRIAAVFVLLLVATTDQLGAKVIKELFQRLRPCNALPDVLTPLGCTGTFSFPSNHALNNFAVAFFFLWIYPKAKWYLITVASLIAISRVYLGLHYPSDILGGAVLGIGFGYFFSSLHTQTEKFMNEKYPLKQKN
ncbi:MAG: phosphatase PAP2 family protein [Ignavibacteria bacterium CG_4_8_14_3_um_filter_37_9]|nr:MAG: phosphatase PAP2 family protein [Ignavibacteria bacterium CG1_02_37_35]PIW97972.1 MAG: phosphatase PAP2 family protein [Ignavibacteria bacterium CG_4_8_14_3_um_filter_37_9]PIX94393.1 MAG: phosphatase PAP2 family protein [Ignavibacteria bacterium CG_4_10_14_3_um_filter_37_18]